MIEGAEGNFILGKSVAVCKQDKKGQEAEELKTCPTGRHQLLYVNIVDLTS